jgi:tRNA pseudouridine32 synthase/23S rRNA pseudouridine746 synthase
MPPAVPPSRCVLGSGPWRTVLEALCHRFPHIGAAEWERRFRDAEVLDERGAPLPLDAPFRAGRVVRYTRDVGPEARLEGEVLIVHADERIVVADKPAGLPVMPTGPWVRETLQYRVLEMLGLPAAIPLHRLDRDTEGLVLFSVDAASRDRYQALFRERAIHKNYEALAPALDDGEAWPRTVRSRLVRGEPFFRMQEADGEPNAETRIDILERLGPVWRYRLEPVTGRKHQLRVQMAALGAPLLGDRLYPIPTERPGHLALLARELAFIDPVDGTARRFRSPRPPLDPHRDPDLARP